MFREGDGDGGGDGGGGEGGGVSYGGKGLECFRICLPPINARSRQTKKSVDRSAQHRTVIHRVLV